MEKKPGDKIDVNLDTFRPEVAEWVPGLMSSSTHDRKQARQNLEAFGVDILPDLDKLLQTKDKQLRWETAKIIESLGSRESIETFISLLHDEYSDIRWIATEGLIRVGRISIVPLLKEVIEKGDSTFVREGAHHVFSRLFSKEENKQFRDLLHALKGSSKSIVGASVRANEALGIFEKSKT